MVERMIFARMDSIERQILTLEKEYKELYKILAGENMEENKEELKQCSDCRQWKPLTEYYSWNDRGKERQYCRCIPCERAKRNYLYKHKEANAKVLKDAREQNKKRKSSNVDKINAAQTEAAAHGMSYGQWVARQYMEQEKKRRKK